MKRRSLLLASLTLAMATLTLSSSTARSQKPIDPACVEFCRQQLFACISAAQSNGEEKSCIAVYRSCTAHCR
jgi:hypothetical protein